MGDDTVVEQRVSDWVMFVTNAEQGCPPRVSHHLTHPTHLLKAALSALGDYWGLVDISYFFFTYVGTWFSHQNRHFLKCELNNKPTYLGVDSC
jgi:hypothetical protein